MQKEEMERSVLKGFFKLRLTGLKVDGAEKRTGYGWVAIICGLIITLKLIHLIWVLYVSQTLRQEHYGILGEFFELLIFFGPVCLIGSYCAIRAKNRYLLSLNSVFVMTVVLLLICN
jgi:hypothetical protein